MSDIFNGAKKLGFGLMRLPRLDDNKEVIDVEQTKTMVDLFMQNGFTYFDTAWVYDGSEEATREALVERYPRDSFTIASKLAPWVDKKDRETAIAQFDTSCKRLGVDYIDYYLMHNLGDKRTAVFDEFGIWEYARELKEEGKIKHLGFSFHDKAEVLEPILEAHPEAEFVQLQINYADWEDAFIQSKLCYETARKYNKPIIVMEPVKGGMLANPPEVVTNVFDAANPAVSYASWAIRFAASLDGVSMVLSGMSNIEQMEDNISFMKDFVPLSDEEQLVMKDAADAINSIPLIPCTKCNYCAEVCPMNIGISGTFMAVNHYKVYQNLDAAKGRESWNVKSQGKGRANECIKCASCEGACPQHIEIVSELEKAAELFGL